jgi:hypothetical protein
MRRLRVVIYLKDQEDGYTTSTTPNLIFEQAASTVVSPELWTLCTPMHDGGTIKVLSDQIIDVDLQKSRSTVIFKKKLNERATYKDSLISPDFQYKNQLRMMVVPCPPYIGADLLYGARAEWNFTLIYKE